MSIRGKEPKYRSVLLRWTFSCSNKSSFPGTAKEVNHAGEQENKKLEIKGGLVGITRRGNSMNKFFLASYDVSQKKETKIHHAMNQNKINIQSENKISLAGTFDTVKLQLTGQEDTRYLLK